MSNVFKGFGGYCDVFGRCFEVFQWYVHGGWMFVKDITILSIYFNVFQCIWIYLYFIGMSHNKIASTPKIPCAFSTKLCNFWCS
jgi:hypothetical protein